MSKLSEIAARAGCVVTVSTGSGPLYPPVSGCTTKDVDYLVTLVRRMRPFVAGSHHRHEDCFAEHDSCACDRDAILSETDGIPDAR